MVTGFDATSIESLRNEHHFMVNTIGLNNICLDTGLSALSLAGLYLVPIQFPCYTVRHNLLVVTPDSRLPSPTSHAIFFILFPPLTVSLSWNGDLAVSVVRKIIFVKMSITVEFQRIFARVNTISVWNELHIFANNITKHGKETAQIWSSCQLGYFIILDHVVM